MQEEYIGNERDYVKYALLRHLLNRLGLRLGINWYLTNPTCVGDDSENYNKDIGYLDKKQWAELDQYLFTKIDTLKEKENTLADIRNLEIFPDDFIEFKDYAHASKGKKDFCRRVWHGKALGILQDAGLIFLDPDNGLEVDSMHEIPKTKPKYVHTGLSPKGDKMRNEIQDYLKEEKVVVCFQAKHRTPPKEQLAEQYEKLVEHTCASKLLPVVGTGNTLFYVFTPNGYDADLVEKALRDFADKSEKVKLY